MRHKLQPAPALFIPVLYYVLKDVIQRGCLDVIVESILFQTIAAFASAQIEEIVAAAAGRAVEAVDNAIAAIVTTSLFTLDRVVVSWIALKTGNVQIRFSNQILHAIALFYLPRVFSTFFPNITIPAILLQYFKRWACLYVGSAVTAKAVYAYFLAPHQRRMVDAVFSTMSSDEE